MKHKLFPLAAAASFALFAGTLCWWIGSDTRVRQVTLQTSAHTFRLAGERGELTLTRISSPSRAEGGALLWTAAPSEKKAGPGVSFAAFNSISHGNESTTFIPAWLLALSFGILPALWLYLNFRKPKKKAKE